MAYRSFGKFWQASSPATIRRLLRLHHPFPGIVPAPAETIAVEILNRTEDARVMAFGQELMQADVGDVIRFVPTDPGRNAQSVERFPRTDR